MNLPHVNSGDASVYLGLPPGTISWSALDARLVQGLGGLPGGSSLAKLCIEMGLAAASVKLSLDAIKQAIQAYFDEHGKTPSTSSGDASVFLGLPPGTIRWSTLNQRLQNGHGGLPGGSSLAKLCVEMELAVITKTAIKQAIQAYFDEQGKTPPTKSGDASPYLGLPPGTIRWSALNARLYKGLGGLPGGSSLRKLCVKMGLVTASVKFSLSRDAVKQALQAYFDEHGKTPSTISGDASPYLGLPPGTIRWDALDKRLYKGFGGLPGGSSLHKLCIKMGLVVEDTKVSLDAVKQAIQAYFDEHGKCPHQKSGDASVYLGLPPGTIRWVALDARLRHGHGELPGGSSLAKLKKEMRADGLLQDIAA